MIDLMRDIRDSVESEVATELGEGFSKLSYLEDIEKNSFRTQNNRYGVRALTATESEGVTKSVRLTQSFEVVLTKGYFQSTINDSKQIEKSLDSRENLLDIYKRLVNTKAGLPSVVLNVTNLTVNEPEYLEDEKVVVQRATMDITYRFSLI